MTDLSSCISDFFKKKMGSDDREKSRKVFHLQYPHPKRLRAHSVTLDYVSGMIPG